MKLVSEPTSCEAPRVAFRFRTESQLDDSQLRLLNVIRHEVAGLTISAPTDGKFRTVDVQTALAPGLERRGFTFIAGHNAFIDAAGTAITVHGGRAYTNNEAVWRMIQLAGRPRVRAVVSVVPWTYKNGACSTKVEEQIVEIAENPGVAIDLDWAAQAPYRM